MKEEAELCVGASIVILPVHDKGKVVPVHHSMKVCWGSGGIAPLIL
jgi:hypothetical protein